jgi:hypothetical protein
MRDWTAPEAFYDFWCRHVVAEWTARPFMAQHTQALEAEAHRLAWELMKLKTRVQRKQERLGHSLSRREVRALEMAGVNWRHGKSWYDPQAVQYND